MGLFLSCERGPLESHTGLFVAFLAAVQQQLGLGLGRKAAKGGGGSRPPKHTCSSCSDPGNSSDGEDEGDAGACPLGLPLVDELLPDSFLRRQFGGFFGMLHEAGGKVPPSLAHQVSNG